MGRHSRTWWYRAGSVVRPQRKDRENEHHDRSHRRSSAERGSGPSTTGRGYRPAQVKGLTYDVNVSPPEPRKRNARGPCA